jgi:hypothetical protein
VLQAILQAGDNHREVLTLLNRDPVYESLPFIERLPFISSRAVKSPGVRPCNTRSYGSDRST